MNFAPFSIFLIRIDCPKTVPSPRDAASQNALGRGGEEGGAVGLSFSSEFRALSGTQALRTSGSQVLRIFGL